MSDTGADTRLAYLWEDNGFNSSPTDTTHKPFGSDASFDNNEGANQVRQVFEPGNKEPIDSIVQMFDGRWSVSFNLVNPWWLRMIFGDPGAATDNGDGSYTYNYSGTTPQSFRIVEGYINSDELRVFTGCVLTRARINPVTNDNVRVTLDGPYAKEENDESGGIFSQPSFSAEMETMTFAQASVDVGGVTEARVQSADLTIPLQAEMIPQLGTRFPVDFITRARQPTVNFRKVKDAGETSNLEKHYGGSTTMQERVTNKASMTMTFDDGDAAGSGINQIVINLTGTLPDRYSEQGVGDPNQRIEEVINRTVEGVTASATNEQSTAP